MVKSNISTMLFLSIIQSFDKLKTHDIAAEIEQVECQDDRQSKEYILIGPGRWGTRDPFLGIPVNWSQISNAV